MLDKGPINDICAAMKRFGSCFSKLKTKICLSLHYNGDNSLYDDNIFVH